MPSLSQATNTWAPMFEVRHAVGAKSAATPKRRIGPVSRSSPAPEAKQTTAPEESGPKLTPSEIEVLAILAEGASNSEIAKRRGSQVGTVKVHLGRIYRKLGVETRVQALLVANTLAAVREARSRNGAGCAFSVDWIIGDSEVERAEESSTLFSAGESGSALFYLHAGFVLLPELSCTVGPGSLIGETAVFAFDERHAYSALAQTPVVVYRIASSKARELCLRYPTFAIHVIRLAIDRAFRYRHPEAASPEMA